MYGHEEEGDGIGQTRPGTCAKEDKISRRQGRTQVQRRESSHRTPKERPEQDRINAFKRRHIDICW